MIKEAKNMQLVGHSDLAGKGDGMLVNVADGYAYVGHMGHTDAGTSVLDVSDPRKPRLVCQIPRPAGTHSHKVQVVGDVLVVNNERNPWEPPKDQWQAGIEVYDISKREQPRKIGFMETPGKGVHRVTYWTEPYAYLSGTDNGWIDQFLIIADLSDPTRPREAGRWWFPGQHAAGREALTWTPIQGHGAGGPDEKRVALHHGLPRGDRLYCGYWDAGLVILDIADKANPTLVSHLDFGVDVSRCTHTAFPVPERDILVVTDEQTGDGPNAMRKQVRVVDISDEKNPKVISQLPIPEGDYASAGGRFGPHNVAESRPGALSDPNTIYLTYFSGGLRVIDISDATRPTEVAYIVPEAPPGRASIQLNDLTATPDGLIYVTDRYAGGLYIFERTG